MAQEENQFKSIGLKQKIDFLDKQYITVDNGC